MKQVTVTILTTWMFSCTSIASYQNVNGNNRIYRRTNNLFCSRWKKLNSCTSFMPLFFGSEKDLKPSEGNKSFYEDGVEKTSLEIISAYNVNDEQISIKENEDNSIYLFQRLQSSETSLSIRDEIYKFVQRNIMLGVEMKPDILAIMTIYFVQGALGLAALAKTFLLKDTLHLGPAEMSALSGVFVIPWTIKPLYGFLSDAFPLFGYRRRSYLVLSGILGGLSFVALAQNFWGFLGEDFGVSTTVSLLDSNLLRGTVAAFLTNSAGIAFSDVVADGLVVQKSRESADDPAVAGALQSLCWGSRAVGGLISAYFSGSLVEQIGPRGVIGITSLLPLLVAGIALLIDEERVTKEQIPTQTPTLTTAATSTTPSVSLHSNNEADESQLNDSSSLSVGKQIEDLVSALKTPTVWKPMLFLTMWLSTPTGEGAFFYFITNDLGLGPEFLGRVSLFCEAAGLFGVWFYQQYLKAVPIKSILIWSSIVSAPLGLTQLLLISHANRALGIPDGVFVFGDDIILTVLGQIAFLPTLVLAARICPPGVEAVLFATLMSLFNASATLGTELGAALTKYLGITESNFDNLGLLSIICNLSSLYPLLFLGLLNDIDDKSEASYNHEEAEGTANGEGGLIVDEK